MRVLDPVFDLFSPLSVAAAPLFYDNPRGRSISAIEGGRVARRDGVAHQEGVDRYHARVLLTAAAVGTVVVLARNARS